MTYLIWLDLKYYHKFPKEKFVNQQTKSIYVIVSKQEKASHALLCLN